MRNKSTFSVFVFLLSFFTIQTNAQEKIKSFDLKIVNYSDNPDYDTEHYHLLSIKNTSDNVASYAMSSELTNNQSNFENVVNNQVGKVDTENTAINESTSSSSIIIEFYDKNKLNKLNNITLQPNDETMFYAKFTRVNDSEVGQSKYFKITAKQKSGNNEVNKKFIIIRTVIPTPNTVGH